jgi:hypothetical protein
MVGKDTVPSTREVSLTDADIRKFGQKAIPLVPEPDEGSVVEVSKVVILASVTTAYKGAQFSAGLFYTDGDGEQLGDALDISKLLTKKGKHVATIIPREGGILPKAPLVLVTKGSGAEDSKGSATVRIRVYFYTHQV